MLADCCRAALTVLLAHSRCHPSSAGTARHCEALLLPQAEVQDQEIGGL